jgi:hypothetical protein
MAVRENQKADARIRKLDEWLEANKHLNPRSNPDSEKPFTETQLDCMLHQINEEQPTDRELSNLELSCS